MVVVCVLSISPYNGSITQYDMLFFSHFFDDLIVVCPSSFLPACLHPFHAYLRGDETLEGSAWPCFFCMSCHVRYLPPHPAGTTLNLQLLRTKCTSYIIYILRSCPTVSSNTALGWKLASQAPTQVQRTQLINFSSFCSYKGISQAPAY